MSLVDNDQCLLFARANSRENVPDLTLDILLSMLVHLVHLLEELVVHRFGFLRVELINLISLDLHLLELEELLSLLELLVQVLILIGSVLGDLSGKVPFNLAQFSHHPVLLRRVNVHAIIKLLTKYLFLIRKLSLLGTLVDFFVDLGNSAIQLLLFHHLELRLVDLNVILLDLS